MEQWRRGKDAQVSTQLDGQVSGRENSVEMCVVTVMERHAYLPVCGGQW